MIYLHPVAVNLLLHLRKRSTSEYVFLDSLGNLWTRNSLAIRLRRARKVAGVPNNVKIYGIRHAFGTRAIAQGNCDLATVAELMGHRSTRMTEHYLHLGSQPAHLASAMLAATPSR